MGADAFQSFGLQALRFAHLGKRGSKASRRCWPGAMWSKYANICAHHFINQCPEKRELLGGQGLNTRKMEKAMTIGGPIASDI